jgi:hypothetical protein
MRPIQHVVFAVLALAVSLLAGCGATMSVLHAKGKPTGSGPALVTVLNSSGTTIDKLFIAKTADIDKAKAAHVDTGSADDLALWGEDELDKSGIEEGKAYNYVKLGEGRYDILVVDKGGREQLIKGLKMKPGGRYVLEIGSDWTMGRL